MHKQICLSTKHISWKCIKKCSLKKEWFDKEISTCLVGESLDFCLVQEHHLNAFRISLFSSLLSRNWDMFWFPTIDNTEVRGGLYMVIS